MLANLGVGVLSRCATGVVQQVCRRVEEKSHLLDDIEVKRYTQGVKRLITVAMTMWPNSDESKNFQP